MKLTVQQNAVAAKSSGNAIGNESEDKRVARLTAFFATAGLKIYSLGCLLALVVAGKSIAQHMEDDPTYALPLESIDINGVEYPIRPGFVLSLATCKIPTKADGTPSDTPYWGCLACGSAHGTGIAPSKGKPKAKILATNTFWYNAVTQDVFTVSDTCWKTYVTDARRKRFAVAPKAVKATV